MIKAIKHWFMTRILNQVLITYRKSDGSTFTSYGKISIKNGNFKLRCNPKWTVK